MIVEEREQIRLAATDPRAVQGVAGPPVVRVLGLEPAEHRRGLRRRPGPSAPAGGNGAAASTPTAPTPSTARRIRGTCAAVRAGFSRFSAAASSSTARRCAGRSPAARAPARRTRRPGSGGSTDPGCPANSAPAFPNGSVCSRRRSRAPACRAGLRRQPRIQRRADQLIPEQPDRLRLLASLLLILRQPPQAPLNDARCPNPLPGSHLREDYPIDTGRVRGNSCCTGRRRIAGGHPGASSRPPLPATATRRGRHRAGTDPAAPKRRRDRRVAAAHRRHHVAPPRPGRLRDRHVHPRQPPPPR